MGMSTPLGAEVFHASPGIGTPVKYGGEGYSDKTTKLTRAAYSSRRSDAAARRGRYGGIDTIKSSWYTL